MEFIRFKSLTNHYKASVDRLQHFERWVATEKVHGSNIQFRFTGGKIISIGSRNNNIATIETTKQAQNIIWLSEDFPNFEDLLVPSMISDLENIAKYYDVENGIFYGELFGQGMQNTKYTANLERRKDIVLFMLHDLDKSNYLPLNDDNLPGYGVHVIATGTLKELADLDVEKRESTYGKEQFIEGIVITPDSKIEVSEKKSVPIIKYKTEEFLERKVRKMKTEIEITEEQQEVINMITTNRLNNILSHGEVHLEDTKDFPVIINAFREDIEKEFDYEKYYKAQKDTLCKFKTFGKEVVIIAKQYLQKQSDY